MDGQLPAYSAQKVLCLLLVVSATIPAHCRAADTTVSIGVRAWESTWSTWGIDQKPYNGASYETVAPLESSTKVAVTPLGSLRYGNVFVSGSYLTKTGYSLTAPEPAGPLRHAVGVRSEVDANVGYYFLQSLSAFVGYKQLRQQFGTTLKWSGPTIGLAGSAPLGQSGFSLYGSLGYGFLELKLPTGTVDGAGRSTRPARYELGEFGLAYSFKTGRGALWPRLTATLGYRTQTVRTRDYALASNTFAGVNLGAYDQADVRDHTQGFTVGLLTTL